MTPHLMVAPVVLPLVAAVALIVMGERGPGGGGRRAQRAVSIAATLILVGISAALMAAAAKGSHQVYRLGDWPAPFGIVLVLDRLSAMMVALTAVVALGSVAYAARGHDAEAQYFHAIFHLQLAGIMGAFLTGDLFNLFVFFEILLIASYCLLVFGGTVQRLRAGVHYVVINLVGSALFLVAIGTLYGVTGTLNMADLAVRIAELPAHDAGLARAGALLLLVVFGLKAALVPLYFWLPSTYASANAAVAALFAIMTKVGVYAIVRVFTLIFGTQAGVASLVAEPWLLPAALTTIALGAVGALASTRLARMQGYLLITSIGTMLAPIGLFTNAAIGAGLYYMVHSTLTMAAMFIITDLIVRQRGAEGDLIERAPSVAQPALLGGLFFLGGIAVSGLPPLSGFIGKGLILSAAPVAARGWWLWGVVLAGSILGILALARAGSVLFWNTFRPRDDDPFDRDAPPPIHERHGIGALVPASVLLGLVVLVTALAGPLSRYTGATADQLLDTRPYIRAVLGEGGPR